MATTRYYFDGTGAPVTPAYDPAWNDLDDAARFTLTAAPPSVSATVLAGDKVAATPSATILIRQAVGPATLPAGPMTGTAQAVIRGYTTFGAGSNGNVRFVIRVVSPDGATVRGTLANFTSSALPNSSGQSSRVAGPVALTPVTAHAGDRLVVELGATLVNGFNDSVVLNPTPASATGDLPFVDGNTSATLRSWVDLILDDPPNPPTGLTQTGAAPASVTVDWTPPASGAAPTSYEYRIDGGSPVDVGLVTSTTITGLTPSTTYNVEVRTIAATGASAWAGPLDVTTADPLPVDLRWWTHRLAASLGLDPVGDQPVVEVRTWDGAGYTLDPDLSNALAGYTVTYGRADAYSIVEALHANLVLATVRVPTTPALATRLQVALSPTVAAALGLTPDEAIRFTGEVTEPAVDHAAGLTKLVSVGRLARRYRRGVDATSWPVEDDGERITRVLTATGADIGTIDPGQVLLAAPGGPDTAAALVEKVVRSTSGQLVEQPHGAVDWHDTEHRRDPAVALTLDASDVFRQVTWSQRISDLVNDVDVKTAAGDIVTIVDPASAHPDAYGTYPATADTILTTTEAARNYGTLIVGRRSVPAWRLPDLEVDLIRTIDLGDLPEVLQLRHGTLIGLTGLPPGCPLPDRVFVEGWTETATPRTWRLVVPVTDLVQSGVSPRWLDYPNDAAYQWQDLRPALTWLELARTTDPADTI